MTGCGGAWNSINCTANASGAFQWSHTWKHCEGSFSNCSSTCSKSINFTINAIIPPAPTVSAPACIASGYSGSGVTISWTNTSPPVAYVDISTDINFGSYANKGVSGTSTSAPAGFSNNLTLNPGTTYYVRTWNSSQHSSTANFNIPACPINNPYGNHDSADSSTCTVSGWACDGDDNNQPIDVHIYADGLYGAGGTMIGAATASQFRSDLVSAGVCGSTGNHGFTFSLPGSFKNGVSRPIYNLWHQYWINRR